MAISPVGESYSKPNDRFLWEWERMGNQAGDVKIFRQMETYVKNIQESPQKMVVVSALVMSQDQHPSAFSDVRIMNRLCGEVQAFLQHHAKGMSAPARRMEETDMNRFRRVDPVKPVNRGSSTHPLPTSVFFPRFGSGELVQDPGGLESLHF